MTSVSLPRRDRRLLRLGPLLLAGMIVALAEPARAQELNREVSAVLAGAKLGSSTAGVSIVDVQTGEVLAAINQEQRLSPASNMKLLTTATALLVLGPDYEFRTRLLRHGSRIVVEGTGDPAFADHELFEQMHTNLDAFIDRLARSVADSGMGRVTEVVVDDRVFDRDYIHPDWPRDQLENWYCAEVSGLNFHTNVLCVFASPGSREGELANIRTEPGGPAIEIVPKAKTVRAGNTSIWAARDGMDNKFTVFGSVQAAPVEPIEVTVHESSLVFGALLSQRLSELGVGPRSGAGAAVRGSIGAAPCRLVEADEELGAPDEVLAVVRTPIRVVLERCNVASHNLYAESLIKLCGRVATGQPGSWTSGAAVVRMQVHDLLGPEAAAGLYITDGSGLSRANKVTASLLAHWLAAAAMNPKIGTPFVESLPRAGVEGTMAKRFDNKKLSNEVRGKSGLINGVRCLSGYITHRETGHRLAYSILVNDIPASVPGSKVKEFHEDVVEIADKWLARHSKVAAKEAVGG